MSLSTGSTTVYDEDYTGPRFTYAFTHRPHAYAHQPAGFIVGSVRAHPRYQFGSIQYPRALTEKEIASYELVDLDQQARDRVTAQELWTELRAVSRENAMVLLRYQWGILERPSFVTAWENGDLTRFLDEDCARIDLAVEDLRAYLDESRQEQARIRALARSGDEGGT